MNVSSLEFDCADFELLQCYNALPKHWQWYLISWQQFISEICKIKPTQNLRPLQYPNK